MEDTLPVPPFWFKQRQCTMETTDSDNVLKVGGPNLNEAFILVRKDDNGLWQGACRATLDGDDLDTSPSELDNVWEAWTAAFELYRTNFIV